MKSTAFLLTLFIALAFGCQKKPEIWDREKLNEALAYAEKAGTFSLIIQVDGEIIASYGDIDSISRVHSIRKAILMALISQHLDKIDLESTLSEIGIDDDPIPLTELQKSTKIIHLLKSTSGINHPAVSQVGNAQLLRDSLLGLAENEPGTKWAYNNWDYNALTTVFENLSGLSVGEAFDDGIAKPLGIKEYETFYRKDTTLSMHAKVGFRLSTRDMAKFGQLFLDNGNWDGKEIIPKNWIENITTNYTLNPIPKKERLAQGFLWWLPAKDYAGGLPEGSYVTTGTAGQRIFVIPEWNMVVAHKVMTDIPSKERTPVSSKEFEQIMKLIKESKNY
ncbi:serine hydrolase [Aureisphaera galaxeae]|uniref:serine hydrolase domain-containing protein n=1 Tax=Aureisphaera galaxeae TaxID=1538023 RepID=UPI002350233F|nr:serine hydrolase [Aureisphaera galaxeae]MDC8004209.1 serine hydrolase [Aureisphaera galaxeae]